MAYNFQLNWVFTLAVLSIYKLMQSTIFDHLNDHRIITVIVESGLLLIAAIVYIHTLFKHTHIYISNIFVFEPCGLFNLDRKL